MNWKLQWRKEHCSSYSRCCCGNLQQQQPSWLPDHAFTLIMSIPVFGRACILARVCTYVRAYVRMYVHTYVHACVRACPQHVPKFMHMFIDKHLTSDNTSSWDQHYNVARSCTTLIMSIPVFGRACVYVRMYVRKYLHTYTRAHICSLTMLQLVNNAQYTIIVHVNNLGCIR